VEALTAAGLGDRLHREGLEHHGIYLQFEGERHGSAPSPRIEQGRGPQEAADVVGPERGSLRCCRGVGHPLMPPGSGGRSFG
jgi:hypothetical protein